MQISKIFLILNILLMVAIAILIVKLQKVEKPSQSPKNGAMETIFARILDLPTHIIPLNIIVIGYPLHEEKAKDKYKLENIRWNTFQ